MNETDFETMIAEARDVLGRVNTDAVYHDSLFQYRGGVLVRELTLIVRDLADALESVRAERDAALARIAELEKMLENYTREYSIECNKRVKAESRIAEAAKLHRPFEWSFGYGPVKSCRGCADRGVPQDKAEWPCPTAVALGLSEGGNDE